MDVVWHVFGSCAVVREQNRTHVCFILVMSRACSFLATV